MGLDRIECIDDYMSENYIIETDDENYLEGAHSKTFVRFDGNFFGELIDNLRNSDSNYVTYFGSLLSDESTYTPKFVSVLKKDFKPAIPFISFKENVIAEVFGSRLANYMNYPTVYNNCIYDYANDQYSVMSVDFVKPGENIISLKNLIDELNIKKSNVELYLSQLIEMIEELQIHNTMDLKLSDENIENLKKDVVKMYLFRRVMLGDLDFLRNNLVFIIEQNNIKLGPNMDMERGFKISPLVGQIFDAYQYCQKNCPEIWQEFADNYDKLISTGDYESIIDSMSIDKDSKDICKFLIKKHFNVFNNFVESVKYM